MRHVEEWRCMDRFGRLGELWQVKVMYGGVSPGTEGPGQVRLAIKTILKRSETT